MMARPPVPASRFGDLLPASPRPLAAWNPFTLYVVDETPLHATTAFADLAIGLYISGRHRTRRRIGARLVEGWSDQGTINLTPSNIDGTWEADAASRAVVLLIPDAFLARVIEEDHEASSRGVEMLPQFLARDPVIEAIANRLVFEAQHDSPAGSLYAESACEFLAEHILHAYSSLSKPAPRQAGGLGHRLKVVVDYIEANLAKKITLQELVVLTGLSARHFERAFRQSMGLPAHAYVLRRRVLATRDLLVSQPTLTIDQIAAQVGFSSASHLASAFRRHTGYPPVAFRRMHTRR
jgi:AraC family transcriptional regulator